MPHPGRRFHYIAFFWLACSVSSNATQPVPTIDLINRHPRAAVHSPVRVTPPNAGSHFWWSLRGSPSSPDKMIICAIRNAPHDARSLENVLHGSDDGGRTWTQLIHDSNSYLTSESECNMGNGGVIYFASSRSARRWSPNAKSARVRAATIFRSNDFGNTWKKSSVSVYLDSAIMLVGAEETRSRDRVDIFFNGFDDDELVVRSLIRSNDGGNSFGTPTKLARVAGEQGRAIVWLADALALERGMTGSTWLDPVYPDLTKFDVDTDAPTRITYSMVDRNGSSIGSAVVVTSLSSTFVKYILENRENIFLERRWPSIAMGPLPGVPDQNRLYLVWHDLERDQVRTHIATSDDNGASWTAPRIIDDLPAKRRIDRGHNAARPSIAVNRYGVVAVQWAEKNGSCWRVSVSLDGGDTFGPSSNLNECSVAAPLGDERIGANLTYGRDTTADNDPSTVAIGLMDWRRYWGLSRNSGIAANVDGSFWASWVSNGGTDNYGIFATKVDTPLPITQACFQGREYLALPKGEDKVDQVSLEYTSLDYDPSTRSFSVGIIPIMSKAYLSNRMDTIFFELEKLESAFGPIEAANADNGLKGKGAVWVFPIDGQRPPRHSSAARKYPYEIEKEIKFAGMRTLQFRLSALPQGVPTPPTPPRKRNDLLEAKGRIGSAYCAFAN